MNLVLLLAALSDLDEAANPIEFDPAHVIGDIREKVDAIHTVMGRLKLEAARLADAAELFKQASKGVEKNLDRLEGYVLFAMKSQGFEKLPGVHWRAQIQATTPSIVATRDATADDLLDHPAFVRRKVEYSWDKKALKEHLANGGKFEYIKLQEGQTVRFYVNKGDK